MSKLLKKVIVLCTCMAVFMVQMPMDAIVAHATEIDCPDCEGGLIECGACESGQVVCGSCGGESQIECLACGGERCESCGYQGYFDCDNCGGMGSFECSECAGMGTIYCISCGGAGHFDHDHEWSYSVSGNTITAKCTSGEGCCLTGGADPGFSISIIENDIDFAGAYSESIEGIAKWKELELPEPAITYVGRDGTSYAQSSTKPRNVGKYTAKMTVYDPEVHNMEEQYSTASKDFEIKKISGEVPLGSSYVIDYASETLIAYEGFEVSSTNDSEGTSLTDNKITPGKTYYIRRLDDGNYSSYPWQSIEVPGRPALVPEWSTVTGASQKRTPTGEIKGISPSSGLEYSKDSGTTWTNVSGTKITELFGNDQVIIRVKATETAFAGNPTEAITIPEHEHSFSSEAEATSQVPTCTENGFKSYKRCPCTLYYYTEDGTAIGGYAELAEWKNAEGKIDALGHDPAYSLLGQDTIKAQCKRGGCDAHTEITARPAASAEYTGNPNNAYINESEMTAWKAFTGEDVPAFTYEYKASGDTYAPTTETKNAGYYKAYITCGEVTAQVSYTVGKSTPSAPEVTAVAPTSLTAADGKVTGVNSDMEYSVDEGVTWTAIEGTEITGLSANKAVKVRVAASNNYFVGAAATVTIPQHEHSGGAATCTKQAICVSCNNPYGSPNGHSYKTTWSTDHSKHWKDCNNCDEVTDSQAHDFITLSGSNAEKKSCDVCGIKNIAYNEIKVTVEKITYDGSAEAKSPKLEVKDGNYTLKEGTDYTVSDVSKSATQVSKTGYTLTLTGKGEYAGTRAVAWNIEPAIPDYTVPTELTAKCGDKLSSVALQDGFTWTSEDCELSAEKEKASSKVTKKVKFTPADTTNYVTVGDIDVSITVAHDYDSGEVTQEPDYNNTGKKMYICKSCGDTKEEVLPALQREKTEVKITDKKGNETSANFEIELTDAAGTPLPAVELSDKITVNKSGKVVFAGAKDMPKIEGYTFGGWFAVINGKLKKITSLSAKQLVDMTVTAKYVENTYSIKYKLVKPEKGVKVNGKAKAQSKIKYTGSVKLYDETTITANGYVLAGWADKNNPEKIYAPGEEVSKLVEKKNGSITLCSVWKKAE